MDSRYRPSTEDIRTAWFQLTQNTESFDRWFESILQETQIAEREHIVSLISVLDSHTTHSELCTRQHWLAERLTTYLKRENK